VTPREDKLTRQGTALFLAHFSGDMAGRDQLVAGGLAQGDDGQGDGGLALANAITYATVVGATLLAQAAGSSVDQVLATLPRAEVRLLPPPAALPWADAVELVRVVPQSNDAASVAARRMDQPGALNGVFAVGVSVYQQLQARTGRTAVDFLHAIISAPPQ